MKLLSLLYYFLNSGFCKCRLKELALIQEIENDIYKTLIFVNQTSLKSQISSFVIGQIFIVENGQILQK